MECKFKSRAAYMRLKKELIDTLWNVNSRVTNFPTLSSSELIDTLWNENAVLLYDFLQVVKD